MRFLAFFAFSKWMKNLAKVRFLYPCLMCDVCVAPQLKLTDDRLTVTGEKGYSMVRATHGI